MFGFFLSETGKLRRDAAGWLEVAQRVWHFRRDELTEVQTQRLHAATGELKLKLKERAEAAPLKTAIAALETVLRETGGRHFPGQTLVENVEFFLVAAIVIFGLRAYFVQPFKIPTNSMWPSYYGMTHELFEDGREPGLLARAGRLLAFGATRYEVTAPADGEVMVPIFTNYRVAYTVKPARTFLFFPTTVREYTFSVGGDPVRIEVPADFNFEKVIEERFAGRPGSLPAKIADWVAQGHQPESSIANISFGGPNVDKRVYWVSLGKTLRKGEKVLTFDILTGDLLFVDRLTCNFFPPKVGQGFVFKTENIHSEYMQDASGNQTRQYYIKRLVGTPGDTLEVRPPGLLRNGRPIEGAAAFGKNARQEGKYPGYTNFGLLGPGKVLTVEPHSYFAMGDNSPDSADSRFWGFVPEKDVVGRPLFIYYPVTSRWGPAH